MNFLKKFGAAVVNGLAIVTGLQPLIGGTLGMISPKAAAVEVTGVSELSQLANVVATVESIGQALTLAGPQKLTAAGPLVAQVILQSSLMVNKKIADPALFTKACTALGGDIADLLNSLHDNAVQTENKS